MKGSDQKEEAGQARGWEREVWGQARRKGNRAAAAGEGGCLRKGGRREGGRLDEQGPGSTNRGVGSHARATTLVQAPSRMHKRPHLWRRPSALPHTTPKL